MSGTPAISKTMLTLPCPPQKVDPPLNPRLRPARIYHHEPAKRTRYQLSMNWKGSFLHVLSNLVPVILDALTFARNLLRSRSSLAAENLFLRKQLTFYLEREQRPRRTDNATRLTMGTLSRLFDWKNALVVVKPGTLIRWHRNGFRLFWRWKSRPKGRPPVPVDLQSLIAEMAIANVT